MIKSMKSTNVQVLFLTIANLYLHKSMLMKRTVFWIILHIQRILFKSFSQSFCISFHKKENGVKLLYLFYDNIELQASTTRI